METALVLRLHLLILAMQSKFYSALALLVSIPKGSYMSMDHQWQLDCLSSSETPLSCLKPVEFPKTSYGCQLLWMINEWRLIGRWTVTAMDFTLQWDFNIQVGKSLSSILDQCRGDNIEVIFYAKEFNIQSHFTTKVIHIDNWMQTEQRRDLLFLLQQQDNQDWGHYST